MTLTLPVAATFDVVSLQEAVDHRGQRIESFVIETWDGSSWTAPPTVDEQTTVGHKRLLRLAVPVTTDRMRIRITGSRLEPTLAEMGLFQQALPAAPAISERSRDGRITLSPSPPGADRVHPRRHATDRTVAGLRRARLPPGWRHPAGRGPDPRRTPRLDRDQDRRRPRADGMDGAAHGGDDAGSSEFDADRAIDADAATLWKARASDDGAPPGLTVDMGRARRIGGFAYLPRQDWVFEGVVDRYRFETSLDGTHWTTQVASGAFDNIKNNPSSGR